MPFDMEHDGACDALSPGELTGYIKRPWAKNGYSWIGRADGTKPDVFVHLNGLDGEQERCPPRTLVAFTLGTDRLGRTCATRVRILREPGEPEPVESTSTSEAAK